MTRHPTAARLLRILLIVLFIASLLVLVPSLAIHSYAELLTLPIDETGGVPPYEWGYRGEEGYEDQSISVAIEHGRF